jgi:hypothetical protein
MVVVGRNIQSSSRTPLTTLLIDRPGGWVRPKAPAAPRRACSMSWDRSTIAPRRASSVDQLKAPAGGSRGHPVSGPAGPLAAQPRSLANVHRSVRSLCWSLVVASGAPGELPHLRAILLLRRGEDPVEQVRECVLLVGEQVPVDIHRDHVLLCARRADITFGCTPLSIAMAAHVCRRSWNRIRRALSRHTPSSTRRCTAGESAAGTSWRDATVRRWA